jgi:tRNA pseudouridine38-40 synthase
VPRYKLLIEYDGGPFVGWQRQANGLAVQEALERAVAGFCGETAAVKGAGRTDAGVHALGQVAHVDLSRAWPPLKIREAVNAHLRPAPVAVLEVEEVAPDFDARFSATARHYLYRILNRRAPPALEAGRVWALRHRLDAGLMDAAAKSLLGRHDFTTFRAAECQAESPVRTLDRLDVARTGDLIEVRASARSFLHSQVRSMVGTLAKVGEGRWPAARVGEALAARDRSACGPLAPPDGLYLASVDYAPK